MFLTSHLDGEAHLSWQM